MGPTLPLRCQSLKHMLLLPGIQFLLVCIFCGLNLIWRWQCQSLSNYRQRRERQETQCAVCTLSIHVFVCLSTKKERFLQGSFPPSDSEQPLQPLQLCLVGKTPRQHLSQEQRTSQRNVPGTASLTAVSPTTPPFLCLLLAPDLRWPSWAGAACCNSTSI